MYMFVDLEIIVRSIASRTIFWFCLSVSTCNRCGGVGSCGTVQGEQFQSEKHFLRHWSWTWERECIATSFQTSFTWLVCWYSFEAVGLMHSYITKVIQLKRCFINWDQAMRMWGASTFKSSSTQVVKVRLVESPIIQKILIFFSALYRLETLAMNLRWMTKLLQACHGSIAKLPCLDNACSFLARAQMKLYLIMAAKECHLNLELVWCYVAPTQGKSMPWVFIMATKHGTSHSKSIMQHRLAQVVPFNLKDLSQVHYLKAFSLALLRISIPSSTTNPIYESRALGENTTHWSISSLFVSRAFGIVAPRNSIAHWWEFFLRSFHRSFLGSTFYWARSRSATKTSHVLEERHGPIDACNVS